MVVSYQLSDGIVISYQLRERYLIHQVFFLTENWKDKKKIRTGNWQLTTVKEVGAHIGISRKDCK